MNQGLKLLWKCQNKLGGGGGGGDTDRGRGQVGCEPRIEVILKMQKKGEGVDVNKEFKLVRVDVNQEFK